MKMKRVKSWKVEEGNYLRVAEEPLEDEKLLILKSSQGWTADYDKETEQIEALLKAKILKKLKTFSKKLKSWKKKKLLSSK